MALAPGTRLGSYEILASIGAGGMGEVYRAEDTRLERQVALKLLPAELTKDEGRLRRFIREAKAASALNHPHIIAIYDIGEAEAGHFIVMELVQGRTLREMISQPCSLESLAGFGEQIARALVATHSAGITHRDIKPDNIMVREDGYVKVLDFGLARLIPAASADSEIATLAHETRPGTLLGTVAYMSPEQARGETVTTATDIFSLGILFYELATGQHPFKANTIVGILHSITSQAPQPPSRLKPEIPGAFDALILRMLEKDASLRPTAAEVNEALHDLQTGRGQGEPATRGYGYPVATHLPLAGSVHHTVGREKQRAELRSSFESVLTGRGQLLCVAGEPGIGKTTLVEDFLAELADQGQSTIARGKCAERLAGTEAYLPLLEALESLVHSGSYASAARAMKQIAPTWYAQIVSLSSDDEQTARLLTEVKAASQGRMKRELGAFLQEVSRLRPLVIFFDDLHWADVSTIDLLRFLADKFDAMRVLIIVTYRPSDLLLAKHPFLQIKPDLQARGVCRELALGFLNHAEIEQYLALEFPGHGFPAEFAKLIHAKTEGSPLFMADLVSYLRHRGVIAQADGAWRLAETLPDLERELPESVRGMIDRKIAQLGEEDRRLLTAASVQGYEFDSAVVAEVLNLDAGEVEERLEKLERVYAFVRLVDEKEFPSSALTVRYRFTHVLYQNALYGSLRATRRTNMSASVAQSLLGFYGEQSATIASQLASLLEAARDFASAANYYLTAAQNATRIFAFSESVVLARRGLEVLKSSPDSPERIGLELNLQLTLGLSLAYTQGFAVPEVALAYGRAREICYQVGESPEFFFALTGLITYHIIRAELETALELSEELLRIAQRAQDSDRIVLAHFAMGSTLQALGEQKSAEANHVRGLELYNPDHDQQAYTYIADPGVGCCSQSAEALWLLGYPDKALERGQQALALARRLPQPANTSFALLLNAVLHWHRNEAAACRERAEAVITLAREKDIADNVAWAMIWRGWALTMQNELEEGIAEIREGFAVLRVVGSEISMPSFLGALAESQMKAGQTEQSLSTVEEALAFTRKNKNCLYEAELYRLKGELLGRLSANEKATPGLSEAEICFHRAVEIARRQQAKSLELRAAMSLARLWEKQGKREEARATLAEIYNWFSEGFDTADLRDAKALLDDLGDDMREASQ